MGTILPKWKRQRSSKETLETLQNAIQSLLHSRTKSQQCERSLVGSLIVAFLFLYPLVLLIGVVIWVWFNHLISMELLLLYTVFTVLIPIMFYGLKKLINMYFIHRKTQYDVGLQTFQSEKKRVLDEVMDKEPYRVARELLEKYDPSHISLQPNPEPKNNRVQTPSQGNVRQRQPSTPHPSTLQHQYKPSLPPPATPSPPQVTSPSPSQSPTGANITTAGAVMTRHVQPLISQANPNFIPPGTAPGPPAPVPILPRDRSNLDRVVEYILSDGPNNRYALICSVCFSHNGMALKDDFEYISFRCAYCYHLNEARKTKPGLQLSNVDLPTVAQTNGLEPNDDNIIEEVVQEIEQDALNKKED